ncbi:flagellar assembly protein FliH [Thalassotalea euphylliae]|uniref:Flagellar assembly protein FliH n=1 Tax=Thalassotalea euphylliae TaxID=1655234 RepID=A0A3E0UE65_9GAMM|nr:flagellar assembly protein FliH [Thalassotalea euphylliae]REL34857.1 flagellar assembly protein FliH [Thalassotalea euphylliae]
MNKFTKSSVGQQVLKEGEQESSLWHLPDVEKQVSAKELEQTNALGKPRNWRYEPPPEPEPEPVPLTAEEIEEIRQAAYEEGFNQGKEEGFAKGYDEGKAQGHQDGEQAGREQGHAEGLASGEQAITELANQWQQQVEQLHQPLAVVEKNIEHQLLVLVAQLTEAVILTEAKTNPDILMAAISEGIKALPSQDSQVQILLHPSDIERVTEQFGDSYIQEQGWRLLPAPQFEPGSCQIENSTSSIDLTIKSRIKQVVESFLQEALHK